MRVRVCTRVCARVCVCVCVCVAESLCGRANTNITLQIDYTLKNKKKKIFKILIWCVGTINNIVQVPDIPLFYNLNAHLSVSNNNILHL